METKKHIRQEIFARRKAAPEEQIRRDSRKIFELVRALPEYRQARCVYAYVDCRHEVMTREFIEAVWRDGKQAAVPKVEGKDIVFYFIESFEELEKGCYGIQEPATGRRAEEEKALMILPGVAFDRERHRVGYGGGFYDRYLSQHKQHPTAAVAFEFQLMEKVPAEPTDIVPEILVTEKQVYRQGG